MEKQGMDRSCFGKRTGLLILLLFSSLSLWAYSGPDEDLKIEVYSSPENAEEGGDWVLSIFVEHPRPEEVTVKPPALPAGLTLDRVRTEGRLVRGAGEQHERWTVVELLFKTERAGYYRLNPFMVSVPGKERESPEIVLLVAGGALPAAPLYRPGLFWESVPGSIREGSGAEILLILSGWDPHKPRPEESRFQVSVPEQVLAERLPLRDADRRKGAVLRLNLIPLKTGSIKLPRVSLQYEDIFIEAPAPSIQAVPASFAGDAGNKREVKDGSGSAETMGTAAAGSSEGEHPFAGEMPESLPFFLRPSYAALGERLSLLWDEGERARVIAELRRTERDTLFGPFAAGLRRRSEALLHSGISEDEQWRPVGLFAVFAAGGLCFCLALFAVRRHRIISRKEDETAQRSGSSPLLLLGFIFAFMITVFGVYGLGSSLVNRGFFGGTKAAVMKSCNAYKVPENDGGLIASFSEGEAVRIHSGAGSWVYVQSSGGSAGWVALENIIPY
ncbi:hypothetical protein LJC14_05955 [Treponema sp. OttesenSCG-928-L16]|nr:hypothetical protein [Treponema sp. OttesenSCG-928-L16]